MLRNTILSGMLAAFVTPVGIYVNDIVSHSSAPQTSQSDAMLSDSLSSLSQTLTSFESRQSGSEQKLYENLEKLAQSVSETQRTSQEQIDALTTSIEKVKLVAMRPTDNSEFKTLLQNFGTNLEKKIDSKVTTMVRTSMPTDGLGTLDVNNNPNDVSESTDVESIQTIPDAARRIIELEKQVAELKSRSAAAAAKPATTTYYGTPTYSTVGGGSTGSYQTIQSQPIYGYNSQPTYQYSQPVQYAQPAQYSQPTRRWFSGSRSSGTCRIVNGVQICN